MPTKIFLCHNKADSVDCGKLMNNLRPAQESNELSLWSSHHAKPGDEVPRYVATNLEDTDIVLLVLSPDHLGSGYLWGTEFSAVLERLKAQRVKLVPVVLRSCAWEGFHPTQGLRSIPSNAQPLVTSSNELTDSRMAEAAREIIDIVHATRCEGRRPVTRVTPIAELNASLKKLRTMAGDDLDGNLHGLMELKQRLRYGEASENDPGKPTRQMPAADQEPLLSASKLELSAGAADGPSGTAARDWRDERIAELEALLVDRDWQLAAGVARFSSSELAAFDERLPTSTSVRVRDVRTRVTRYSDLGDSLSSPAVTRQDNIRAPSPASDPPLMPSVQDAPKEESPAQRPGLRRYASAVLLGVSLLAAAGAMGYLGATVRIGAARVEASATPSTSGAEPVPAGQAVPAVSAALDAPSGPTASSRTSPSSLPAGSSASPAKSPSTAGSPAQVAGSSASPAKSPSTAGSPAQVAGSSASPAKSPSPPVGSSHAPAFEPLAAASAPGTRPAVKPAAAKPAAVKRPSKIPVISTADPFGPKLPEGL